MKTMTVWLLLIGASFFSGTPAFAVDSCTDFHANANRMKDIGYHQFTLTASEVQKQTRMPASSSVAPISGPSGVTEVTGTGTIQYIDLEGGFYGIIGDDGKQYLPMHLAQEFKADGLRVTFRLHIRADVVTIYMWGTPVEVISLKRVE